MKRILNPFEQVFVEVNYDESKLSITGVVKPRRNGDADSYGQIESELERRLSQGKPTTDDWTPEMVRELCDIWHQWHLNNMRPGCEHQRAEQWDKRPIDPSKPLDSYGEHIKGEMASWNMLTCVPADKHPEGLLSKPCPVCGYKYGTKWLFEVVPAEVISKLKALPETKVQPAWV